MPGPLHIPVSHGRLEALIDAPEGYPIAAAVVCHPHPLHGGTMHNHVTYRIAKTLTRHGILTLRFNFRGVGTSTGKHGDGISEAEDVQAALDRVQAECPGLPLWIAGFSFGARVGLAAAAPDHRVTHMLGVGLVPRMFDFGFLETTKKPKAFVHGAEDELADLQSVEQLVRRFPEPRFFEAVATAKHLFPGKLAELEVALDNAVSFLLHAPI